MLLFWIFEIWHSQSYIHIYIIPGIIFKAEMPTIRHCSECVAELHVRFHCCCSFAQHGTQWFDGLTGLDWWPLVTEDSRLDRLYPSNLTHRQRSAGFCRRACRHKKKRSSACASKMFSPCIFGEGRCLWFTRSWFDSGSNVMTWIFFFANIWVMVTDLPFLFEVQHRGHAWGLESDHMNNIE